MADAEGARVSNANEFQRSEIANHINSFVYGSMLCIIQLSWPGSVHIALNSRCRTEKTEPFISHCHILANDKTQLHIRKRKITNIRFILSVYRKLDRGTRGTPWGRSRGSFPSWFAWTINSAAVIQTSANKNWMHLHASVFDFISSECHAFSHNKCYDMCGFASVSVQGIEFSSRRTTAKKSFVQLHACFGMHSERLNVLQTIGERERVTATTAAHGSRSAAIHICFSFCQSYLNKT